MENKIPEKKQTPDPHLMTIVGIGTSAGGLNALKTFFSNISEKSNIAYVVVVHLSPEHKSVLPELIQRYINIPVLQVQDTVKLEPDHVYVIPPNANLNTIDTHLRLTKLEENRTDRAPIDHFFRTLSQTHKENAIGVVLTGTGSDGTLGLKEIKEKGGLTIVQDPEEAEYDGMPQSAISTGMIDMILPLKDIPLYIFNYLSTRPKLKSLENGLKPDSSEQQLIQKIFSQMKARTGRDFSRYKLTSILRRLQRRMQIYQVEKLEGYVELLRKNPEEVRALSDDFLITVTNFFRDPEVFSHIEKKIIPQILANKNSNEQVRVWSVGCATGEEAYSLAILLTEALNKIDSPPGIQIFASDLHEVSLKKAREGFFPGDIKADVSPERLNRFFIKEDGGYRIRKDLKEMVIFTPHNLLGDPPFSRIDLVVCRNLLIYLKREVQRDVFDLFHYSLLPNGFLVLGTSEHIENSELYTLENKEFSVYRKKNVAVPETRLPVFPLKKNYLKGMDTPEKEHTPVSHGAMHLRMIEQYAPPSLLVSADFQVMHLSENAGRYLIITGGELSRDIFKLVRPEMQMELRSVFHVAKEKKNSIRSNAVFVSIEGKKRQVFISVRPVIEAEYEQVYLVMFEEYDEPSDDSDTSKEIKDHKIQSGYVKKLEQEISESRQKLQAIIEEYETSREEMKASNEELQSANEELRSTMEELETSKEELQSLNEELTTLNQENRHKVDELALLSNDLQNLLSATDIATLFIDKEFRILRFTPKVGELFNIRATDQGRPISDITHKLGGYSDLITDARKVLKDLQPVEKEISNQYSKTFLTRMLPYRSSEDRIEGVVITYIDISGLKVAEEKLKQSEERFRALVNASSYVVYRMSPDWKEMHELDGQGLLTDNRKSNKNWLSEYIYPDDQPLVLEHIHKAIQTKSIFSLEYRVLHADDTIGWTFSQAVPLLDKNGDITEWFGAASDITARKKLKRSCQKPKFMPNELLKHCMSLCWCCFPI